MKAKIHVVRFSGSGGLGPRTVYTSGFEDFDKCCPDMATAIDDGYIVTSDDATPRAAIQVCHPYPEGAVFDAMAISHCPFCGEAIDVELVEEAFHDYSARLNGMWHPRGRGDEGKIN